MPLNLTKTYTVKSNAQADVRKAAVRGECTIGEFTVVSLSGGFRIVPVQPTATPSIEEVATSPAGWRAPEIVAENAEAMTEALAASRDDHVAPGLARLRADDRAETIREAVIADQALAQMREELISGPKVTIGASVMADYRAEHPAPVRRGRKNGLRKRAEIENKVPRWPSLKKLLAIASDEGWLDPNGFLMPFEAIIMARNHVQHGHPQLFHQFSLMILEVVCQILNALYPNVSAAAPGRSAHVPV